MVAATGRARVVVLLLLVASLGQVPPTSSVAVAAGPDVRAVGVPRAWALDSATRLTRAAAPGSRTTARISAARGETESFQVAVHADGGPLTGGDLRVSALTGPGGAVIPAAAATRYREHFVRVRRHSPDTSGPVVPRRWFPDALLPFEDPRTGAAPDPDAPHAAYPYGVATGRTQPFWVDLAVPRRAPAGDYTGTWTVRTDQGSVTGAVALRVRDFTLPRRPVAGSSFGVWRDRTAPATERLLLDYALQPSGLLDPAAEGDLIARGLRSTDIGFWSGANIETCTMDPPPSRRAVRREAARHDPRLRLYAYTADEISACPGLTGRLRAYARRLHAARVDHLVVMRPRRDLLDDGTGRPAVDIWALLPQQARHLDPRLRRTVLRRGTELWSYQALVQGRRTPSWEIDFPAANFRILPGFLNAATGYTGVLYWAVDYWRPNPWKDVVYTDSGCCYPGEGALVYPGGPAGVGGVVPSIRLAWLRDGVEDYGYVERYRRLGGPGLRRILRPAAVDWNRWTRSAATIADVRDRLAVAIERVGEP